MTSIILLSINFGKRSWKLWKRLVLLLYESNNLVPRAFPLKNGWGGKSCYRIVLRLKFIVTVELLYDQAESDFVQCQTKMRAFASGICSEFKQIELNWNRIVHQNTLWSLVFSTTRPWNKQISAPDASLPSSQERWQVVALKHFKISYILSLPRISTKDFPYIKGKIDRSIGINYTSVNFKWIQVFLCQGHPTRI